MNFFQKAFAIAAIGVAAIGSPSFAGEEDKGIYVTGSVGYSKILDIDIEGIDADLGFDGGVNFDLGLGYDFGNNLRLEATWDRAISSGTTFGSLSFADDTTVDGFLASAYYDFDNNSKWTPFLGGSVGTVNADVNGESASSFYYGIQAGVSYEATEDFDIFGKLSYLRANDLDYAVLINVDAPVFAFKIGGRYSF